MANSITLIPGQTGLNIGSTIDQKDVLSQTCHINIFGLSSLSIKLG